MFLFTFGFFKIFVCLFVLVAPCGLWDIHSPIRPKSESTELPNLLDRQGIQYSFRVYV